MPRGCCIPKCNCSYDSSLWNIEDPDSTISFPIEDLEALDTTYRRINEFDFEQISTVGNKIIHMFLCNYAAKYLDRVYKQLMSSMKGNHSSKLQPKLTARSKSSFAIPVQQRSGGTLTAASSNTAASSGTQLPKTARKGKKVDGKLGNSKFSPYVARQSASESCLSTPRYAEGKHSKTDDTVSSKSLARGDEEFTWLDRALAEMMQKVPRAADQKKPEKPPEAVKSRKMTSLMHRPAKVVSCCGKNLGAYKSTSKMSEHNHSSIGNKIPVAPITARYNPPKSNLRSSDSLVSQIKEIHSASRKSAKVIKRCKKRLLEIQQQSVLTDADIKEIADRNETLLAEMERFDRLTRSIQVLVGGEVSSQATSPTVSPEATFRPDMTKINAGKCAPTMFYKAQTNEPVAFLTSSRSVEPPSGVPCEPPVRSRSEIDLSRKLTESYDMQEKLVADNADLEVKRYIMYKELMTKDQSLEACRGQIKRLQGELKMLSMENAQLMERGRIHRAEEDAKSLSLAKPDSSHSSCDDISDETNTSLAKEVVAQLESYKSLTGNLEKQLGELEIEVRHVKIEMDQLKLPEHACRNAGKNVCHADDMNQRGPPIPPMSKACGMCPPCPAPCNPNAPPTPAEREVQRLTIQLRETEQNFKQKVTECAMLRVDLVRKREELEKEKCMHSETAAKLRELEMKYEGLTMATNKKLGTVEQAFENEVNLRALKRCYQDAREEIDELRVLIKEQNEQIQDYRVKYLAAQQMVEEQKRQMDMMDMDNTRISEQINLEIQKVKLRFQEKLQELAPIPDLLKATQMRLKDAQQAQAIAEHNAEMLARELNIARERIHMLMHTSLKTPEKPPGDKMDEKAMALLQQKITQLQEVNAALKEEVERLKSKVLRLEEAVLMNEKRLQEKMHECAALGGELDRARDEASRAVQRANERTETNKKCLQTTVAELERQLAASRAQVASAAKEREEIQNRMNCQIKRLNDNFEQAQLRIFGLQTQVQTLRRNRGDEGDDGDCAELTECACKSFFEQS